MKGEAEDALGLGSKPRPPIAHETKKLELDIPVASNTQALQTPPPVKQLPTPTPSPSPSPSLRPVTTQEPQHKPSIPTPIRPNPHANPAPVDIGLALSTSITPIHWTKLPEKFPVPPQALIKLPNDKAKSIPRIQHEFKAEEAAAKADRLAKLDKIRTLFTKSWTGYRKFAWEHDELRPQSGTFRDPFAGWRATLVDALDTLWIMGLKDEFEEAVKAVEKLDFTTTPRADIPLFETTIRYLGGLLAAYDISGKKYKVLLQKAVELAEVLISAFDTPNRMPETYYYWRPQFASQKHRASSRVVLAEIGSLSMEFTRLAQLTGENKFYDAVARITDNLEDFQKKTKLPGMWPTYLDASGCGKVYIDLPVQAPLKPQAGIFDISSSAPSPTPHLSPEGKKYVSLKLPDPIIFAPAAGATRAAQEEEDAIAVGDAAKGKIRNWEGKVLRRRQLDLELDEVTKVADGVAEATSSEPALPTLPECVEQGFASTSDFGREEYTLGGMSDSTYEYLPKEYLLLGGSIEKYRAMYEQSMDVIKEHLVFRPMLPKEEDILFCGKLNVPSREKDKLVGDLVGENAHLTCFAGGMFGMGAKIFDRPEDLEMAKKLTEGCVWSYDMTQSGIMPESFEAIPCESRKECAWNETLYHETLDPRSEYRLESYKDQMKTYHSQLSSASSWYQEQLAAMTAPPTPVVANPAFPVLATATLIYADTLDRRQLAHLVDDAEMPIETSSATGLDQDIVEPTKVQPLPDVDDALAEPSQTLPAFPYIYTPVAPLNHKDYVQNKIQEERLPPGVTRIGARNYILR